LRPARAAALSPGPSPASRERGDKPAIRTRAPAGFAPHGEPTHFLDHVRQTDVARQYGGLDSAALLGRLETLQRENRGGLSEGFFHGLTSVSAMSMPSHGLCKRYKRLACATISIWTRSASTR
jgi:hypothetical protein